MIKAPNKREKLIIRTLILIGLLSVVNFFYWFVNPGLIEYDLLFVFIMITMVYETLKIIYLWYHYWDISIPQKPKLRTKFTVDVLTTYFPGEPYEMIIDTLTAIQKIKYPHTTYLCDEANDEFLKEFCKKNNVIHVTRNNRVDAKAGNINNALKQATGEICLILDPDHVPKVDILDELIPYFENDKIGFVQSVQAYYNINESLVARGAAEQTFLFYGPIMMGMNSYGSVNAIGANCCFRRKALDSIGGHAAGLSEDMHTAMKLHAEGWESVYVPKALTKGLVPASITSYYKQQLKWSRGTLELLFEVYPKLFSKFTMRQKIHYGILPLHYLSGLIYLIAFLVPVISLFTASIPWKGSIINFAFIYFPVIFSIIGVKVFVQKWLIHKSENGIHLIGGILQAATWWIFCIGFFYTIIGKKVPYLPTPKEDKLNTHFAILLPNLIVVIISGLAIIYGLSIDFTPFTVFMSGFAALNIIYMLYTFAFAYEKSQPVLFSFNTDKEIKSKFDRVRNLIIEFSRKIVLPLAVISLIASVFIQYYNRNIRWETIPSQDKGKNLVNFGIFSPVSDSGITSLEKVHQTSQQTNIEFNIVSLYLAWDQNIQQSFPDELLDSIYLQKTLPMITWEPWINSFEIDKEVKENTPIFELITEGYFDNYILEYAQKLREINRPVFLRFAHEFDNPMYPWYIEGNDASVWFKKAWVHVYEIFKNENANNVIWVWNPWKSENIVKFYPGEAYVDWLSVNMLNYGSYNSTGSDVRFKDLYQPFHDEFQKLPDTPVMISEFGTLGDKSKQKAWFNEAFKAIENKYHEINSVVFFNSRFDSNIPDDNFDEIYLDWTIKDNLNIDGLIGQIAVSDYLFNELPVLENIDSIKTQQQNDKLSGILGINLKKGHDWKRDYDVLSRKRLIDDFESFETLGINTIKYEGNSIYDYNVLNISRNYDFNISFGFWIFPDIDFINDSLKTKALKKEILDKISKYKDRNNITSWNIQNDVLYYQKDTYNKPERLYQNLAYISWLKNLIQDIKRIDPDRPVFVDVEVSSESIYFSKLLLANIPEIDALGLVVEDDIYLNRLKNLLENLEANFIYSEIREESLFNNDIYNLNQSFFVTAWQDQYEINKLVLNGITDRKNRYKEDYFNLYYSIHKTGKRINELKINILKPASLLYEKSKYNYTAMVYTNNESWKRGEEVADLAFEWSLLKCDINGNKIAMKVVGNDPLLLLKIPKEYEYYKLMLTVVDADTIKSTITTLNTPLYYEDEIR